MANDPRKRILAISLEGGRRAQALAAWDGERLIVTDIREISGNPDEWLPVMLADIEAKVERGWVVMVEDRTGSFPSRATAYNFDALGPDGRTHLQSVLDWYFALDGHHIQFNVVDRQTLIDAQKHPEDYKDLIVRVAGYSDFFRNLDKPLQDEIIERTEQSF